MVTPVAITTAIDSTRSSTRTFSYSASTHHVADLAQRTLAELPHLLIVSCLRMALGGNLSRTQSSP